MSEETKVTQTPETETKVSMKTPVVEKLQYFFAYNKRLILIGLVAALVVIFIAYQFIHNAKPRTISYAIVNNGQETNVDLFYDYAKSVNKTEDDGYKIVGDVNVQIGAEAVDSEGNNISDNKEYTTFPSDCRKGKYDVVITDSNGLDYILRKVSVKTPEQVLDAQTFDKIKGHLATYKLPAGQSSAFAIDITETKAVKKLKINYAPVYMIVPGITKENRQNAKDFCRFMFKSEAKNTAIIELDENGELVTRK